MYTEEANLYMNELYPYLCTWLMFSEEANLYMNEQYNSREEELRHVPQLIHAIFLKSLCSD